MRKGTCFLFAALAGCAHQAQQADRLGERRPSSVSLRESERNGPCAVLGPKAQVFGLSREQGAGIYAVKPGKAADGATSGKTQAVFFTSTPEGCEGHGYRASKNLVGYIDNTAAANECTLTESPVVSKTEQKNLSPLFEVSDRNSGFKFYSFNKKACANQGFAVEELGYANP